MNKPKYPLYIPSKGRHQSRLTSKWLDKINLPYKLVVEPNEYDLYAQEVSEDKLLALDMSYKDKYEYCDEHGTTKPTGSGPARNFIWDHSVNQGHDYHWIMDDNIRSFRRMHLNEKIKVNNGSMFIAMEDFILRYKNVGMAGPHYTFFRSARSKSPPFTLNSRVYSCNLIKNDLPFRWRGRYNEDTILSLDLLKAGWCTILFNAFLQEKMTTQTVKGGNTDTIYVDGTLDKSQMLVNVHPDVSELKWRYGRWHHSVDYKVFKTKLVRKEKEVTKGVNNFGMNLVVKKNIDHEKRMSDIYRNIDEYKLIKYPIYIPSKGRFDKKTTTDTLEKNNIPFFIVVEPHEYTNYLKCYDKKIILKLPKNNQGISYVRNFCKTHAKKTGFTHHWQIDDNIKDFRVRKDNKNILYNPVNILSCVEHFVDTYKKIDICGLSHVAFAFAKKTHLSINKQVYSCVLIKNDDLLWREDVVEDTDYSLQVLSKGACTVLFNKLLINKAKTTTNSGGNDNTDQWRLKRSLGLQHYWGDWFEITEQYGRVKVKPSRIWKTFEQELA